MQRFLRDQEEPTAPANPPAGAVTAAQARYLEAVFLDAVAVGIDAVDAWPGEAALPKTRMRVRETAALPGQPAPPARRISRDELPGNLCREWRVVFGSLWPWSQRRRLDIVAGSHAPLDELAKQGWTAEPAGEEALEALTRACSGRRKNAVTIAFSPTGWKEGLMASAGSVLVAPGSDGTWDLQHNVDAPEAKVVQAVLGPKPEAERARCAEALAGMRPGAYPLSARQMARELQVPLETVFAVFREAAECNLNRVVCEDPGRNDWLLELV